MVDEESLTVWVGNFDPERVTQDILYELFLQAGPIKYVRIPKDRATGKLKNFAFVCFRHSVSVPYAIELLNGTPLFSRSIKVQSRYLQDLQQRGLGTGPGGIHTLNPFSPDLNSGGYPQGCGQQELQMQQQQQQQQQQQSILGPATGLLRTPGGHIPQHILAMAHQQMALLATQQPVLLTDNPMLNAPRQRTADRFGSVYHDRNYRNQSNNRFCGQNQQYNNTMGRPRSVDNQTMQAMKSHFERQAEENSEMLAQLQQRQSRFDYSRLGPRNDDRHHRQNDRYDNTSRHQRQNDTHHSSSRGNNDRHDNSFRYHRQGDNNYGSSHRHDDSYGSRNRHDPYKRSYRR